MSCSQHRETWEKCEELCRGYMHSPLFSKDYILHSVMSHILHWHIFQGDNRSEGLYHRPRSVLQVESTLFFFFLVGRCVVFLRRQRKGKAPCDSTSRFCVPFAVNTLSTLLDGIFKYTMALFSSVLTTCLVLFLTTCLLKLNLIILVKKHFINIKIKWASVYLPSKRSVNLDCILMRREVLYFVNSQSGEGDCSFTVVFHQINTMNTVK